MNLEDVKRDFIRYMEEVHAANPYPRNFIGCIMAISAESQPVSQDRIVELTGYSQSTVSIALQKILLLLSIGTVKKIGDRKIYYRYEDPATSFVLDILQRRIDVQDIDFNLVDSILKKTNDLNEENTAIIRFRTYLENTRLYLHLIHKTRSASVEPFKHALATASHDDLKLQDAGAISKGPLAEFLLKLKEVTSKTDDELSVLAVGTSSDLILLKNEYFTGIKTYLNPLFSQVIANQLAVVHCILLEGDVTQDQIELVTLLPRSTISEVLAHAVNRGIVKTTGSRPKYYRPLVSLSDLMLASFDRVANYILQMTERLSYFVKVTKQIRPKSDEVTYFRNFLSELEGAYKLAHAFSIDMKVKTVKHLKSEFEGDFEFI